MEASTHLGSGLLGGLRFLAPHNFILLQFFHYKTINYHIIKIWKLEEREKAIMTPWSWGNHWWHWHAPLTFSQDCLCAQLHRPRAAHPYLTFSKQPWHPCKAVSSDRLVSSIRLLTEQSCGPKRK